MSAIAAVPISFTPHLEVGDALAASWLAEITLRLRREVAWMWFQRGTNPIHNETVPPLADAVSDSLDLTRYADDKRRFFEHDVAAKYLSEQIAALRATRAATPGRLAYLIARLHLDEAAQFVLGLALAARADHASAAIFGACQHDVTKTLPSLALAQRLYDDPSAILHIDAGHALFRYGLLHLHGDERQDWHQPYDIAPAIARALLANDGVHAKHEVLLPSGLAPIPRSAADAVASAEFAAAALALRSAPQSPQWLPLVAAEGADYAQWASRLAALANRTLLRVIDAQLVNSSRLATIAAWCWLHDADVLLPPQALRNIDHTHESLRWPGAPVRWWVPLGEVAAVRNLPANTTLPALVLPRMSYAERAARWQQSLQLSLGSRAPGLDGIVEEVARRFRFEAETIDRIAADAAQIDGPVSAETLTALCRTHAQHDMGNLAQRVTPRFSLSELVLPPAQTRQLQEIVHAMRALTRVHYRWGTARAWNDAGLSVLFCGAPGTGKTMGAEALAQELQLPMYRIDLSQVVNKYIGETEKNLRRVFDAAEASDCVLFFDEADALFGKRTDVKDAHDRFANIEISYLLERMERFKGIAVLATNRRKDLDEAFMRRLRYVIEFPLPGIAERERLWHSTFPREVDSSALDVPYLARQFTLAGGHIRSIAFNACLQAANDGRPKIEMQPVLCAVKRELDKLNRPLTLDAFGAYRDLVAALFSEGKA